MYYIILEQQPLTLILYILALYDVLRTTFKLGKLLEIKYFKDMSRQKNGIMDRI